MSDHNKQSPDKAFSDWIDGKMSEEQSMNFEKDYSAESVSEQDKIWQERLFTANSVGHHAEMMPQKEVPHWDRGSGFSSESKSWWQWSGLPALSMAMSVFAVALVLFKVELIVQPEGILLSFAGSANVNQEQQLSDMVDLKLKEFASEQQVVLANYAADIKVKQQDSNLQLASYILSTSRQERKEDINDFIGYINDQRKDEQLNQKIKFQQLERAIQFQNVNSDGLGGNMKPANWVSEE